ncbi:MAG: hypothetical protein WA667_26500 [Candidatus Nitrosopolaris sp.]
MTIWQADRKYNTKNIGSATVADTAYSIPSTEIHTSASRVHVVVRETTTTAPAQWTICDI